MEEIVGEVGDNISLFSFSLLFFTPLPAPSSLSAFLFRQKTLLRRALGLGTAYWTVRIS